MSTESLTYYYPPVFNAPGTHSPPTNLSAGFDSFVQRDDGINEHLDALLDTLQAHEERLLQVVEDGDGKLEDVRTKADIITWRGMMTKILTAPFDIFNEFEMNATRYQGTIFIEENHAARAARRTAQNKQPPPRGGVPQEMMQYWGYKFEAISTLPNSWSECSREEIEARDTRTVNNNAQYCSIVRTGMGARSLIIAGEVDAVLGEKPDSPNDPIPWIELKTTAELTGHPREAVKFERKLLNYWAQSFLLAVPTIMIGFRTPDGFLSRIQEMPTHKIPTMVRQGSRTWDGNVCINVASAFLEQLAQAINEDGGVYRIRRKQGEKLIEIFEVGDGSGEILKPSFKTHREKLRALEISAALGK
ncbi:hypothetical protein LTR08_005963 [Meristemomyces frigidus]|nr:hypothetical protein LTR08_005963 [Meristemomyces frigidus]